MMPSWTPETWGDFGVVGIVVFMAATFFVALIKGWIVIGRNHNEALAGKDAVIADKNEVIAKQDVRSDKDAETINTLSQAVIKNAATEDATRHILSAFRDAVKSGGP